MSVPNGLLSAITPFDGFIVYNMGMLKNVKRALMVVVGIMLIAAPAAQASALIMVPTCAPMMKMQAGPHSCCRTCDCKVEKQKNDFSFDLPTSAPRFESKFLAVSAPSGTPVVSSVTAKSDSSDSSPPTEDPLYQKHSSYRL